MLFFPVLASMGTHLWDMVCCSCWTVLVWAVTVETCCGGSCDSRVDGEPNGCSEIGEDDREDNREDGRDGNDDLEVVGVNDDCIIDDNLSQSEVN